MSRRIGARSTRAAAAVLSALALSLSGLTALSASAASPVPAAAKAGAAAGKKGDIREPSQKMLHKKLSKKEMAELKRRLDSSSTPSAAARSLAASKTPPIGTQRNYLILDDYYGRYRFAPFTLRSVGQHIEAWVQNDLNYPAGDCRNDGNVNVVTDAQVQALVDEFDSNILPKESEYFSVAPDRDGSNSPFGADAYAGDGDKTVALISNVRDANYYAPQTDDGKTYIAGFFSSTLNYYFDRNTMTIDSYDWAQRTGAHPTAGTDGCGNTLAPRPRLYEGTFAHEYQHLLESYASPGQDTWMNEGLSDYAQTVVGYADTTIPAGQPGADSHLGCFYGFSGTKDFPFCGAENSLTMWGDQGSASILSDYGAAYSMITYIENRFGRSAITALHNDADHAGLGSLQALLDSRGSSVTAMDVLHDWAAMLALDGFQDDGAKLKSKGSPAVLSASQLHAGIDWDWSGSYDSPGAPPNGSDYVQAFNGTAPLTAKQLRSISFEGASTYAPEPMEWTVAPDARPGNPALFSGSGNELDRAAVVPVSVPASNATLSFSTKYNIEQGWDFGVVQVSTDGGKTYTSLANADTTSDHDGQAAGNIVAQLPGFTGVTDWTTETFDLSAYAGKDVLLSFRYLTDAAQEGNNEDQSGAGWWVDDVTVGGTLVSDGSSVAQFKSITQISPNPVAGWALQIVGWDDSGDKVYYGKLPVGADGTFSGGIDVARQYLGNATHVGVIVTVDDPSMAATKYATYTLKLNGQTMPGGS